MAENKRNQNLNFTAAECSVIFEEAEQNIEVIKSKFTSTLTNKNKTKVWEDITAKVNSLGVCLRSVSEVKEKWRGMVGAAKKEFSKFRASQRKTVGGEKPASPKTSSKEIIEIFGDDPSFSRIQGGLESVPVSVLDTPSLGLTEQEISGAEAGERDVSVTAEIALPPTCLAQLQVPIIADGHSSQQNPSLSSSHQEVQLALPKKDAATKKRKRECMEDKIHEMHLIVLTKESKKLDMEMENLLLKREKLQLEIKKFK
ncbi:PREDICTED: myb/SANT-like DNA-binding domain-containing protein 4 isoform X2 [Acropora digitifera]|uniref:myb/SANT-like DNA-binding domain-containing protein 4 isoform X2 n=1 Tax=Acropora digitifera TaxID=70779 RepID=UPI00077AA55F|nr:PREDICTED: myb/SANT-like DNA-binding domain-containing protein 4 isoform X2 [Acropora digitifera]